MFTRIQTSGYRSLKAVDQELGSFQALVGPNASGKTTFLDVIGFLSDLMLQRGEITPVVQKRSATFEKLVWMGKGNAFQLAVEAQIPNTVRSAMSDTLTGFDRVRYELEVGVLVGEVGINHEILWLVKHTPTKSRQVELFPVPQTTMPDLISRAGRGRKVAVKKAPGGNDNYYNEGKRKTYNPSFKLGRSRSALANLPADTESFPVSSWFRTYLEQGVQPFVLNSQIIQKPSPPGLHRRFRTDGSNLPWVVAELRKDKSRFGAWLNHVRTALPDITDVAPVERPEDRHSYLVVHYANGAAVPSWLASDGTLRLLALTIPAYLPDIDGTFLIEEPENGVHPRALETVLQSLSSIYGGQVLIATHSPVALNLLAPAQILCFAKDGTGATDIVVGDKHPALRDWREGEPDLGVLFASGILG
jgi:predicted ATPase